MAQTPKLQVPQITRIRAENVPVADALQNIVNYTNQNVTPAAGNRIIPLNQLK